jgi:DNA-binding transcriptional MerR regulator
MAAGEHDGLLIGEVSKRTGFPPPTIRYYEEVGLLKKPPRAQSGYRAYSSKTVDELLFVKKAQGLGFSLDEIAEVLKLCVQARSRASACLRCRTSTSRRLKAGLLLKIAIRRTTGRRRRTTRCRSEHRYAYG